MGRKRVYDPASIRHLHIVLPEEDWLILQKLRELEKMPITYILRRLIQDEAKKEGILK